MAHHVLILAAGYGLRLKSTTPKQFLEIHSLPIIMHSMKSFFLADPTAKIYVALSENYLEKWSSLCVEHDFDINHEIYVGGATRQESVYLGLKFIYNANYRSKNEASKKDIVSIHDAARPFVNPNFISGLITAAQKSGNAVPFLKLKSAVRKKSNVTGDSVATSREDYITTQTPQVFTFYNIYNSYKYIMSSATENIFDDSAVYDCFQDSRHINLVNGREYNIKITTELDYILAESIYEFFKNIK